MTDQIADEVEDDSEILQPVEPSTGPWRALHFARRLWVLRNAQDAPMRGAGGFSTATEARRWCIAVGGAYSPRLTILQA